MKQKIYIETSVVSYLVARTSKNIVIAAHQASTSDFWNRLDDYDVFISDIVIQEASKGNEVQANLRCKMLQNFQVLEIDNEVRELARKFLAAKIIPEKCPEDALHIAVAAANGMDVIVTWNFKHINNPFIRKRIRQVVDENMWNCPEICSPEEFLGNEL
ncbi:MAG: type II toxin-antitoxin system VapC family toxin [Bacteroidota bacterium]|nr:type II toxin-antitoxin system VapC family toxin [Bacteroidota bacterium]